MRDGSPLREGLAEPDARTERVAGPEKEPDTLAQPLADGVRVQVLRC
jgi:hypothetical protein